MRVDVRLADLEEKAFGAPRLQLLSNFDTST